MVAFQNSFNRAINRLSGGLIGWLFGDDYTQNSHMTANRAFEYNPVWSCVSMISGSFVIMPLNVHRLNGRDRTIQDKHSSYQLMRWRPNAYQTPSKFKQQMLCHALLWGNARAYIRREGKVPVELIPLRPDATVTMLIDGEKWHATQPDAGDRINIFKTMEETPEKLIWLNDADVWHVPGLGFDGVEGKSVIHLARKSWAIGLDAEEHVSKQQKKGYAGGLALEVPPGQLRKQEEAKEFIDGVRKEITGPSSESIFLLREGVKANVMAMSNSDAQFIEQRKLQIEDVERWFNIPGLISNTKTSYASMEQTILFYRTNCLSPWATAIEEECDLKLLSESERRRGFYHKFNEGPLLRTEKAKMAEFASSGITNRWLSPNEVREMFDLSPYTGGDEYENPNTISRDSQSDNSSDTTDTEEDVPPATRSRVEHMISVETKKVVDAAKKATAESKNFLQWVDDFYDKKWKSKLSEVFVSVGLEESRALAYCDESKNRLLQCCDYSTVENLVENVEKCVFSWKIRNF